jgi:Mg2+ and Co2+ transporter CorA
MTGLAVSKDSPEDQTVDNDIGRVADNLKRIRDCVLDCGKAIVANNAKIELLTDKVCSAVADQLDCLTQRFLQLAREQTEQEFARLRDLSVEQTQRQVDHLKNLTEIYERTEERLQQLFELSKAQAQQLTRLVEDAAAEARRRHESQAETLAQSVNDLAKALNEVASSLEESRETTLELVNKSQRRINSSILAMAVVQALLTLISIGGVVYLILFT